MKHDLDRLLDSLNGEANARLAAEQERDALAARLAEAEALLLEARDCPIYPHVDARIGAFLREREGAGRHECICPKCGLRHGGAGVSGDPGF